MTELDDRIRIHAAALRAARTPTSPAEPLLATVRSRIAAGEAGLDVGDLPAPDGHAAVASIRRSVHLAVLAIGAAVVAAVVSATFVEPPRDDEIDLRGAAHEPAVGDGFESREADTLEPRASARPTRSAAHGPASPAPAPKHAGGTVVRGDEQERRVRKRGAAVRRIDAARTPRATVSDPDAEMRSLRAAHAALESNDFESALDELLVHEQRFPRGLLAVERDATRVVVLCGLGRRIEARDRARAFLVSHPDSPYAARVRATCSEPVTKPEAGAQ